MSDIILAMLRTILGSGFAQGADGLKHSAATYNSGAFAFVNQINSVAVKPVAAVIAGGILVLQFARISAKYEGDHKAGTQQVAAATITAAMIVVTIQNTGLIIGAINEIGDKIIRGVAKLNPGSRGNGLPDGMVEAVENMDTIDKAGLMLILFLPWIIGILAGLILKIVIFMRFAEMYLLIAGSTLPISFLGHPETKSIAIGFLKKYAKVVLKGVAILIVIALYTRFQIGSIDVNAIANADGLKSMASNLGSLIAGPIFFIFLIVSTDRIASALVGD